ncbi:WhiB family transcriptional regulator [Streptomyces sp. NPDC005708]|uniref:WhiB family transcriptional regulator n=1 Tax=Streptomyces sp. NPDC005708 TaxID=3154564 RepID=UPI0033CBABA4
MARRSLLKPLASEWDWQMNAACRGMDSSIFFAVPGESRDAQRRREERARSICSRCKVQTHCAAFAVKAAECHGIWGGQSMSQPQPAARKARTGPDSDSNNLKFEGTN